MSQLRACACLVVALLLTGCTAAGAAAGAAEHPASGHAAGNQARAAGHVTGRLLIEGGPIGTGGRQPGERPIPGTVTFTAAGHRPVSVGVGTAGKFSAWLPPGRYRVSRPFPGHRNRYQLGQDRGADLLTAVVGDRQRPARRDHRGRVHRPLSPRV